LSSNPDRDPPVQCGARATAWGAAARPWVGDGAAVLLLAAGAALATLWASRGLDELVIRGENGDVWFEADCPRVFANLTDPISIHSRSGVHPLFALVGYPAVALVRRAAGLEPLVAVRVLRALTAGACAAAFYTLLRHIGCRRFDSVLFTVLAAVSAASMFWFVVPETYPPGLLSILLALLLVSRRDAGRTAGPTWDVLVNLATLAFTITNWIAGLLVTLVCWPVRKALGLIALSACLGGLLLIVQQQFFPSALLLPIFSEEWEYTFHWDAAGPLCAALSFFMHSIVMPTIQTTQRYGAAAAPVMTIQQSGLGSSGAWGVAATAAWLGLVALGVYGLYTRCQQRAFRIVLGLTVAGQFLLHLVYGLETFTYACHFGPLLVIVSALATITPARRVALLLVLALIPCVAVNNAQQFARARACVQHRTPARAQHALIIRHSELLTLNSALSLLPFGSLP